MAGLFGGDLHGHAYDNRLEWSCSSGVRNPPRPWSVASVVNNVVDGIITIDERGTVTTFIRWRSASSGYPALEVVGQNVKMLMPEPYHGEHDGYIAAYLQPATPKSSASGER